MSEIENLIAQIERSILYDDKPKTWNFDSVSYVARLIAHVKDIQMEHGTWCTASIKGLYAERQQLQEQNNKLKESLEEVPRRYQ